MSAAVSPAQSDVYTAVKAFLLGVLPLDSAHVVQGYPNRAAMPGGPFVVMTMVGSHRLRTNVDTWDTTNPAPTVLSYETGMEVMLQLDVYGPSAGDWAQELVTLWRDDYGCQALAPACQPLYSDDPRRMPLIDGEDQYEDRWTITARLQYNPTVTTPQDFADAASVTLINVDKEYPP